MVRIKIATSLLAKVETENLHPRSRKGKPLSGWDAPLGASPSAQAVCATTMAQAGLLQVLVAWLVRLGVEKYGRTP
jgi:hypothetical protein